MDLLTSLFGCVGLQTNTTKTKLMTFVPGKIWAFLSDTACRTWMDKGFCGKGKGWKVECSKYGKELEIGPLAGHLAKQHDSTSRSCWRRTGTARRLRRLGCGTRRTTQRKGVTASPFRDACKAATAVVCGTPETFCGSFPTAPVASASRWPVALFLPPPWPARRVGGGVLPQVPAV